MEFKRQSKLIFAGVSFVSVVMGLGVSSYFFSSELDQLDEQRATQRSNLIRTVLNEYLKELSSKTASYHGNLSWLKGTDWLQDGSLTDPQSYTWLVYNSKGKRVFGHFPSLEKFFLREHQKELRFAQKSDHTEGVMVFPEGPLLFSARGIFKRGTPAGTLLLGKLLTSSDLARISDELGFKVSLHEVPNCLRRFFIDSPQTTWLQKSGHDASVGVESGPSLAALVPFYDFHRKPAFVLRFDLDESVRKIFKPVIPVVILSVLFSGVVFFFATSWIMEKLIVNRFEKRLGRLKNRIQENKKTIQSQEVQLQFSEKLASLGTLVAGVVHEIANPLTTMIWVNSRVSKIFESNGNQEGKNLCAVQLNAAERVLNIVNGMRRYARADSAGAVNEVSLHEAIQNTILICQGSFKSSGVEFRTRLQSQSPLVMGDLGRLQQVVMNLLVNAKDAIEAKKLKTQDSGIAEITVTTEDSVEGAQSFVVLKITDSGIGMSPELKSKIFKAFYTTKGPEKGSGLGLSITHSIVSNMGGRIEVESTEGVGSTFVVTFPSVSSSSFENREAEQRAWIC